MLRFTCFLKHSEYHGYLQAEEESKLRAQVSGLDQELASEKSQKAEVQRALEQSQENLTKLQSDIYGKESEISATRQDLKVQKCRTSWRNFCVRLMGFTIIS